MNTMQYKIIELLEKSSLKGKQKVSPIELGKKLALSQRDLKKEIKVLVETQILAYWSSGSGSYIMLQNNYELQKDLDEAS